MLMLKPSIPVVGHLAFGHDGRLNASGAWHGLGSCGTDVRDISSGLETIAHHFPDQRVNGFIVDPTGRWLYVSADSAAGEKSGYFAVDPSGGTPHWLGLQAWNSFKVAVHPSGDCVEPWMTPEEFAEWERVRAEEKARFLSN